MDKEQYIGHYRVTGELGRGGMGVVYKAFEDTLNRHVAIKVLSEQLASHDEVVERFKREAKSMGALNDPHIIQIYLIGEHNDQPFFAMEFVEGESLGQRLKREGKLPVAEARRILKETAEGLATAHDRGVIHRDIKPGNLMLDTRGRVKIADFGIAMTHELGDRLTRTGEFVGTPGYLSPEVCTGKDVDQRSDIFALGIVFYEMLTGDLPFTESSPLGMMLEVVKAEIPDIREVNKEIDDRTYRILTRMIAKDPDERYQDCHELIADLEEAPGTQPGMEGQAEAATMVSGPGATVAMPTPAPASADRPGPQPASPPPERSLAKSESRELAEVEKKSRGPWLALAAVLVIALGAGGTYAFRDQIFGKQQRGSDSPGLASRAVVTEPSDEPASTGPEPADEDLQTAVKEPEQTVAQAEPANAEPVDTGSDAAAAGASETAASDGAPATAIEGRTLAATEPEEPEVVRDIAPQQTAQATSGEPDREPPSTQSAGSSETSSSSRPQSVSPAAEPAPSEQQLAKLTTPAAPPEPRIVVMAVGDPAIAGPVERMLENRLMGEDLDLLDESFISDLTRAIGPDRIDLGQASRIILDEGGTILVLAQVDYIGETELQYYGQYSTLYSVNLNVRSYDLAQRRALGPGISEKVDFTNLNAEQKAKEALSPHLAKIADSLKAETRKP